MLVPVGIAHKRLDTLLYKHTQTHTFTLIYMHTLTHLTH